MKKILIVFLFTNLIFAKNEIPKYRGVITVLEAPVFRIPNVKAKVIKYFRKGDVVFIHPKYFAKSPTDKNFDKLDGYFDDYEDLDMFFDPAAVNTKKKRLKAVEEPNLLNRDLAENFYLTIDELGQRAYIPKRFVKLIYRDEREFLYNVNAFEKDPTDYRLAEPLPKNYPFYNVEKYRFWISLGAGTQAKKKYPYPDLVEQESFSSQYEFKMTMAWKIHHQLEERMYFGGIVHVNQFKNEFQIFIPGRNRVSEEKRVQFGIGPYISYDTIRFDPIQLTLYQGFLFNLLNNHEITQTLQEGTSETRTFAGTSFSSTSGLIVQKRNFFSDHVDLLVGTSLQIELPYDLSTKTGRAKNGFLWQNNDKDRLSYSLQTNLSFFLGLQLTL